MAQEYWACPHCPHVGPAHSFKLADGMGWDVRRTALRRRCPVCRRAARAGEFRPVAPTREVAADRHDELESPPTGV